MAHRISSFEKMLRRRVLRPVTWFGLGVAAVYAVDKMELFQNESVLPISIGTLWLTVAIVIWAFATKRRRQIERNLRDKEKDMGW